MHSAVLIAKQTSSVVSIIILMLRLPEHIFQFDLLRHRRTRTTVGHRTKVIPVICIDPGPDGESRKASTEAVPKTGRQRKECCMNVKMLGMK